MAVCWLDEGKPGLPVSLLSQAFVLILLFFLDALSRIHEVKLCMLSVMGTSYGPLCYSQTIQFFNLSSCNVFLSPSLPYQGASFGLGYRGNLTACSGAKKGELEV